MRLLVLVASLLLAATTAKAKEKKQVLVFGGTGMVSAEVVVRLLDERNNDYEITIANRGVPKFDSTHRVMERVTYFELDRDEGLSMSPDLLEKIDAIDQFYAVIDFSGVEPEPCHETFGAVAGKTRVYIYVSCASVYEVSEEWPDDGVERWLQETDAVRPKDEKTRAELIEYDEGAHDILQCEEALMEQRQHAHHGFPYVILRLSQLLGPRDLNGPLVHYMTWAKYHHHLVNSMLKTPHIHVPHTVEERLSVTFSHDAARAVILAAHAGPDAWDEAYNIACDEIFNVTSAIEQITLMTVSGHHHPPIAKDDSDEAVGALFQLHQRGPVNVTKAKERLGFKPTPIRDAIGISVQWYEQVFWSDHRKEKWLSSHDRREYIRGFVYDWAYELFWHDSKTDDELETDVAQVMKSIKDEL